MVNSTSMLAEIQRLRAMSVAELQQRWHALYGEECRSRNRDYLWRRLSWRTQELARGGLTAAARTRLAELAPDAYVRARTPPVANVAPVVAEEPVPPPPRRDPRLPVPGTVIVRDYRGRQLRLTVLDDGYELDGVRYGSLTEAAKAATGSHWNGRLFWGLTERKRKA